MHNALKDAISAILINPELSKGYSRKGVALHVLKNFNRAVEAFEEGLVKFPEDAALKKGLEVVRFPAECSSLSPREFCTMLAHSLVGLI